MAGSTLATLGGSVRTFLLAVVLLLAAAPAGRAQARPSVDIEIDPVDQAYGKRTVVTGTVQLDGAPVVGQSVQLVAREHPYDGEYRVIARNVTDSDGMYRFAPRLDRNADLRVRADDAQSERLRAFVYPAFTLAFRTRSDEEIVVIARYRVPLSVRLARRTLFYVAERGEERAPIVARAETLRRRAGRYRASAVVEIPARWKGRFHYAGCLPYSPGTGMGDPRAACPKLFKFD
jgi:hypothetical protein